jgi:hypothetical protein
MWRFATQRLPPNPQRIKSVTSSITSYFSVTRTKNSLCIMHITNITDAPITITVRGTHGSNNGSFIDYESSNQPAEP